MESHEEVAEPIAPWDGRRVPVTLLAGYLGAGKTTVLNELLAATDRPVAVLVNDVGEINLDAALVRRRSSDTIELTDGCVCCSMSEGLLAAFDGLRSRPTPPDHLLVELSGIADPTRVVPHANSIGFRLDSVATLIDGIEASSQLDDPRIAPLVERQILAADIALVTKAHGRSAAERAAVRARVEAIDPSLPIHVVASATDAATLVDAGTRRPGGVADHRTPSLFDPHVVECVTMPVHLDLTALEQWLTHQLDAVAGDVVRAKGVAGLSDGSKVLVQRVGRRQRLRPLPTAEDQPATDLVVISLPR